jgi:hypothetical protein
LLWTGGLAALNLLIHGCASSPTGGSSRPRPTWSTGPTPRTASRGAYNPAVYTPAPAAPSATPGGLTLLPRSQWTSAPVNTGSTDPMNGVSRLTVHHDGMDELLWADDLASSKARLELIRKSHLNRGFADIGYHYVIDRAGRVWEGRPMAYQGAHAGGVNNQHNVGVLVLGNFDRQQPTVAQLQTLPQSLRLLMAHYRVPVSRVYTHQELKPTACPGTSLQARMVQLRRSGYLA